LIIPPGTHGRPAPAGHRGRPLAGAAGNPLARAGLPIALGGAEPGAAEAGE
jgi:hypothetical protein